MDNNNNPQIYDSTMDYSMYSEDMNDVFSNRYDRYDNRYNERYNDRYYNRYDNYYDNDGRYNIDFNRRMRYYQYPYCDRYGRCENPIWWLFWPFFFM
ncbi:MAG TPA: hypothetical protein DCM73_12005 [Clostridiales bacterium]|nr:hypothetical protein [Clostridiales bacterium]